MVLIVKMATLSKVAADITHFSPPLVDIGLTPSPMSPEDHVDTFVDVFVAMFKSGMVEAAPVSANKVSCTAVWWAF